MRGLLLHRTIRSGTSDASRYRGERLTGAGSGVCLRFKRRPGNHERRKGG